MLVVDDSITVREVERQLLLHKGYDVEVAVDGVDGWNKVRAEQFDLVVSDIDMPRMTGLQLVAAVRADAKLRDLPVIIVSYKEREEDRIRGLGGRRELLPHQEQLPRQSLHRSGRGPDRAFGTLNPIPFTPKTAIRHGMGSWVTRILKSCESPLSTTCHSRGRFCVGSSFPCRVIPSRGPR